MGKGVRQGDPLAPFLFIIAAEAFNIAMKEACDKGVFNGFRLPNLGPSISHMQYADDTIVVGEWSVSNFANIIRILHCFYLSSGLKININKSNLLGFGVAKEEVENLARKYHCKAGYFPFFYLGFPIGTSTNKCESWAPIINKFLSKLSK